MDRRAQVPHPWWAFYNQESARAATVDAVIYPRRTGQTRRVLADISNKR